ncbi:MKI67 FHA domain-interacting nucleolar phosphoprotein [Drosophila bipectinata]|uniref:MKI67 FHA domain-interacting nucleolar phosphoprotein n=1 Tax=Drosophila bipectinata TaxID=42026 RepID=UPI001C894844|nr:MKI67 FHA domain-interacting nucleolar phosphoprotein [Drosophila bipectinata]
MPPVKKPKAQKIEKVATPIKKAEPTKDVVSGQLKKKLKPQAKQGPDRGVVLVQRLPHGFFEQQLRQYFSQFGRVLRVRLGRSERTGNSRGFAFVEFEYPEVAQVAAETMDNYLMFQKVVKAKYIPPEKQTVNYFRTSVKKVINKAGKQIFVSNLIQARQRSVTKQNDWNEAACQKRTLSNLNKIKKVQEKYKHLGIDFSNLVVEPIKKSKAAAEASTSKDTAKSDKKKKEPKLEDLLGNTITEDSDDEDYVDASDDESEVDLEDDSEEEEDIPSPPKKTSKKLQPLADKLKRKPGTGGVQKKKAAPTVKAPKNDATQKLQLAAAKKLAKPLPKKAKKSKK